MYPLALCMRGAMIYTLLTNRQDKLFTDMTVGDWEESTRPKIQGSRNLYELLPTGLEFFVLLSSLAGVVGAHGQSNYAAGNVFQDEVARCSAAHGNKTISLDLGMIADQGVVAENESLGRVLASYGYYQPMTTGDVLRLLDLHCDPESQKEGCAHQVVCGIRPPKTLQALGYSELPWMNMPLFEGLQHLESTVLVSDTTNTKQTLQQLLKEVSSLAEAADIITVALSEKVSASLGLDVSDIDVTRPIHFYGVDSLIAVELRNWFANKLEADVAVMHILGNTSVQDIASIAAKNSRLIGKVRNAA